MGRRTSLQNKLSEAEIKVEEKKWVFHEVRPNAEKKKKKKQKNIDILQTIAYAAKQTPEGQTRHSKRIDSSVFVTGVFLFGKKKKKNDIAVIQLDQVISRLRFYL